MANGSHPRRPPPAQPGSEATSRSSPTDSASSGSGSGVASNAEPGAQPGSEPGSGRVSAGFPHTSVRPDLAPGRFQEGRARPAVQRRSACTTAPALTYCETAAPPPRPLWPRRAGGARSPRGRGPGAGAAPARRLLSAAAANRRRFRALTWSPDYTPAQESGLLAGLGAASSRSPASQAGRWLVISILRSGLERRHLCSIRRDAEAGPGPHVAARARSRPGPAANPHSRRRTHGNNTTCTLVPSSRKISSAMTQGSRGQPPGRANRSPGAQGKGGLAPLAGRLPWLPPNAPVNTDANCPFRGSDSSLMGPREQKRGSLPYRPGHY